MNEATESTIEVIDSLSWCMHFTGAPDIFCVYSGLGQGDLALVLGWDEFKYHIKYYSTVYKRAVY